MRPCCQELLISYSTLLGEKAVLIRHVYESETDLHRVISLEPALVIVAIWEANAQEGGSWSASSWLLRSQPVSRMRSKTEITQFARRLHNVLKYLTKKIV